MNKTGRTILTLLILAALAILLFAFKKEMPAAPEKPANISYEDVAALPIFSKTLAENNINVDSLGFTSFSPDGKHFLFTGFKNTPPTGNYAFLADLENGTTKPLPGMPQRGFENSKMLELFDADGLVIYEIESGQSHKIHDSKDAFGGELSPDEKKFIMNTPEGIVLYNLNENTTEKISSARYDGAYAWFGDSRRVLGFRETNENLFEAGRGREIGIWNIETKEFEVLPVDISVKSIRYAKWLVDEKIARVNAGYDDGSYDYILDVESKKLVELGDTSGALMGGIVADRGLEVIGILGAYRGSDYQNLYARVVDKDGKILHDVLLPDSRGSLYRSMALVDRGTMIYLKDKFVEGGAPKSSARVVMLDLETGEEYTVEEDREGDYIYTAFALSPDKKFFITTLGNRFALGQVPEPKDIFARE